MKIAMTTIIDLDNIKVTNAIASVVNSAFETGINPAWFEVHSLNKGGFLDAAFADSGLETPSKKEATTNWTLKARLNDQEGYTSKWVVLTPEHCVQKWIQMANDKKLNFLDTKARAYLQYLSLLSDGLDEKADKVLMNDYEPDGVHDDAMAQYAIAGEVVFG